LTFPFPGGIATGSDNQPILRFPGSGKPCQ
jgi:hypothetical protein